MNQYTVVYAKDAQPTQVNLSGAGGGVGPARVFNRTDNKSKSATCRTKKLMLSDAEALAISRDRRFTVKPTKAAKKAAATSDKPPEQTED